MNHLILALLLLPSCKNDPYTREGALWWICDRVFSCDYPTGWGWGDPATCEANFLGSEEYMTTCGDEDQYLDCMEVCLKLDCECFAPCEAQCWADWCWPDP